MNTDKVRVKDLISFLQRFDPELPIYLDRDNWSDNVLTVDDKIRKVVDDSGLTHRGENYLIINN